MPTLQYIELTGLPGSGKSTLRAALLPKLHAHGPVVDLNEALTVQLARHLRIPFALHVPAANRFLTRFAFSMRCRPGKRLKILAQHLAETPVLWSELGTLCADGPNCARGEGVYSMCSLVSNLGLIDDLLTPECTLFLDEGFCHKALPLFGFASGLTDIEIRIQRFLAAVPLPGMLVHVDTPVDLCEERLYRRGWPPRYQRLNREERRRVLCQQAEILELLVQGAAEMGVNAVRVEGQFNLSEVGSDAFSEFIESGVKRKEYLGSASDVSV